MNELKILLDRKKDLEKILREELDKISFVEDSLKAVKEQIGSFENGEYFKCSCGSGIFRFKLKYSMFEESHIYQIICAKCEGLYGFAGYPKIEPSDRS